MTLGSTLQVTSVLLLALMRSGQPDIDHEIRSAKTCHDTEVLIRKEVGDGHLNQLLTAYDQAYAKTHEPACLYGYMRTRQIGWWFNNYYSIGVLVPRSVFDDMKREMKIVERVPIECKGDAYALAAYYDWVKDYRELWMPKPKEKRELITVTVNGEKQQAVRVTPVSDPWKDRRLDEIFHKAWKLDPHNPMVLYVASWRTKGETKYDYLKQAYETGGKALMPERLLDSIVDQAKKLGKAADAAKYSALLDAWRAANKGNLWGKIYEFDADYVRKHAIGH